MQNAKWKGKPPKALIEHLYEIPFPVLGQYTVTVAFTNDPLRTAERLKVELDSLGEHTTALTLPMPDGVVMLFNLNPSVNSMTHESYHAVRRMFKWAGADIDNELIAYHLGYLMQKVVSAQKNSQHSKQAILKMGVA